MYLYEYIAYSLPNIIYEIVLKLKKIIYRQIHNGLMDDYIRGKISSGSKW